jgi:hypothetical protein
MPKQTNQAKNDFVRMLDTSWAELEACLARLNESEMTERCDEQGWNVKDHVAHLAAWDESAANLFQGKPRHETLGIALDQFTGDNIDQINADIRERWQRLSVQAALHKFRSIHQRLLKAVSALSEVELDQPAAIFFPQMPPGEERSVRELLYANSAFHFQEHLPWIKKIGEMHVR